MKKSWKKSALVGVVDLIHYNNIGLLLSYLPLPRYYLPIITALPLGSMAKYCPGTMRLQPDFPNVS